MKQQTGRTLLWRVLLAAVAVAATVFTIVDNGALAPLYYTSWSVWFATLTALGGLWDALRSRRDAARTTPKLLNTLKFCAMIMIVATFIVSAFVLPDKIWMRGYWTAGSIFKHFLLPILTVVDALCCTPRGSYRPWQPFAALLAPLCYWVCVIVRFVRFRSASGGSIPQALWDSYYPYGFTNLDQGVSLGGLCGLLGGILVGLILCGYLVLLLRRRRPRA